MRACIDALKPRSDYRREFVELFGPTIERNFDVVLCQFPGWQCALFQELRVGLAVRFTHRFDHHIWYGGMDAKAEWDKLLAGRPAASVVHHCGSGVTAVPNMIAMELAGFGPTALYAGSWSEWCRNPVLPCAQG